MERIFFENKKYDVVSLFSGIGGFDLGFENAGFNVIWANDYDKFATLTYKANVSNNIVLGDINDLIDSIPKHDVLVGGFPCQPFSSLGKKKGFDDERGTLFFTIKEILLKHQTKVVVLENVKNLKHHDGGNTLKRIIRELEEIGYSCSYEILNSLDFGIPQRRNRIFIVAFLKNSFKDGLSFSFPNKIPLTISTQDLLDVNVDRKYSLLTFLYLKHLLHLCIKCIELVRIIISQTNKVFLSLMILLESIFVNLLLMNVENYKVFLVIGNK